MMVSALLRLVLLALSTPTLQMQTITGGRGYLPALPAPPFGLPVCLDEHAEERSGHVVLEHLVRDAEVIENKHASPAYEHCKGVFRLRVIVRDPKMQWTAVGKIVDEFLVPRLSWSVVAEPGPSLQEINGVVAARSKAQKKHPYFSTDPRTNAPVVVLLQYNRGYAASLMDAVEAVQHPAKYGKISVCPTLHYFYEDRSFLGLTISSFAGAFFEFKSTGIPFQPVTSRKWTYADVSWKGCSDNLHQLECFFLAGSSCGLSKHEWNTMTMPRKALGRGVPGAIMERRAHGHGFNRTEITKYRKVSNANFRRYPAGDWRTKLDEMTIGAVQAHKEDNRDFVMQLRNKVLATHAAFLQVFLRPNFWTRQAISSRISQWKSAHPHWGCDSGGGTCVAMHVRHGDKLTHYWMNSSTPAGRNMAAANAREFNHTLWDYTRLAARRVAILKLNARNFPMKEPSRKKPGNYTAGSEVLKIFLMTDDLDVVAESTAVERESRHWQVRIKFFWVQPGRPLQSTSKINEHLGSANHEKKCTKDRRFCAFDYARDPITGKYLGPEELLQFLVSFTLMAEADVFIAASSSSHFTRLILAWVCSSRGDGCPVVDFLGHWRDGRSGKALRQQHHNDRS
jgi:hypothetical protein